MDSSASKSTSCVQIAPLQYDMHIRMAKKFPTIKEDLFQIKLPETIKLYWESIMKKFP